MEVGQENRGREWLFFGIAGFLLSIKSIAASLLAQHPSLNSALNFLIWSLPFLSLIFTKGSFRLGPVLTVMVFFTAFLMYYLFTKTFFLSLSFALFASCFASYYYQLSAKLGFFTASREILYLILPAFSAAIGVFCVLSIDLSDLSLLAQVFWKSVTFSITFALLMLFFIV